VTHPNLQNLRYIALPFAARPRGLAAVAAEYFRHRASRSSTCPSIRADDDSRRSGRPFEIEQMFDNGLRLCYATATVSAERAYEGAVGTLGY